VPFGSGDKRAKAGLEGFEASVEKRRGKGRKLKIGRLEEVLGPKRQILSNHAKAETRVST